MRAINVKEGIIAIEDNKPDAIEAMRKACQGREGVRVQVLKTKYPQGGEKQLIEAVTGRQVPSGGLPIQAGVIVMNVATCAAVADAVIDGKPLVERIVTVTGAVREPANLRLRIGTITEDIIGECGGFSGDVGKVIFGGAMTGMCAPNTSIPIAKATGGILVLDKQDAASVEEGPCLRCGKCVEVCPIGLHPLKIKIAADADRIDECKRLHVMDCTLCGSCSFICPAHRWLTASFKVAKQKLAAPGEKRRQRKMSLILSPAPHVRTKNTTQRLMLNVVISLLPCAAAGIYYFGLRAAIVLAVSVVSAVLAELVWQKLAHQTVRINDFSAVVTGLLLGLCITPSAPWWMVMIGAFFAIIVVKQLFGGIGDNFLNPALTARAVLLASWPR